MLKDITERLSLKRLNELILDENQASKEYQKLGFDKLAKDEKKHEIFLRNLKKKYY